MHFVVIELYGKPEIDKTTGEYKRDENDNLIFPEKRESGLIAELNKLKGENEPEKDKDGKPIVVDKRQQIADQQEIINFWEKEVKDLQAEEAKLKKELHEIQAISVEERYENVKANNEREEKLSSKEAEGWRDNDKYKEWIDKKLEELKKVKEARDNILDCRIISNTNNEIIFLFQATAKVPSPKTNEMDIFMMENSQSAFIFAQHLYWVKSFAYTTAGVPYYCRVVAEKDLWMVWFGNWANSKGFGKIENCSLLLSVPLPGEDPATGSIISGQNKTDEHGNIIYQTHNHVNIGADACYDFCSDVGNVSHYELLFNFEFRFNIFKIDTKSWWDDMKDIAISTRESWRKFWGSSTPPSSVGGGGGVTITTFGKDKMKFVTDLKVDEYDISEISDEREDVIFLAPIDYGGPSISPDGSTVGQEVLYSRPCRVGPKKDEKSGKMIWDPCVDKCHYFRVCSVLRNMKIKLQPDSSVFGTYGYSNLDEKQGKYARNEWYLYPHVVKHTTVQFVFMNNIITSSKIGSLIYSGIYYNHCGTECDNSCPCCCSPSRRFYDNKKRVMVGFRHDTKLCNETGGPWSVECNKCKENSGRVCPNRRQGPWDDIEDTSSSGTTTATWHSLLINIKDDKNIWCKEWEELRWHSQGVKGKWDKDGDAWYYDSEDVDYFLYVSKVPKWNKYYFNSFQLKTAKAAQMLVDDLKEGKCRIAGSVTLFAGPADKKIKAHIIKTLEYCLKQYQKGRDIFGSCDIWAKGVDWKQGPIQHKLKVQDPEWYQTLSEGPNPDILRQDYSWSQGEGDMVCGRNNGVPYWFIPYNFFVNAGPTGVYIRFETKDGGFFWKEELNVRSKSTPRKLQSKLWGAVLGTITGNNPITPAGAFSMKQILGGLGLDEESDSKKPKADQNTARTFKNTNVAGKQSSILGSLAGKMGSMKIDPKMFASNTLNLDYSFFSLFNRFCLPLLKVQAFYSANIVNSLKNNLYYSPKLEVELGLKNDTGYLYKSPNLNYSHHFESMNYLLQGGMLKGQFHVFDDIDNSFGGALSRGVYFYHDLEKDFSTPEIEHTTAIGMGTSSVPGTNSQPGVMSNITKKGNKQTITMPKPASGADLSNNSFVWSANDSITRAIDSELTHHQGSRPDVDPRFTFTSCYGCLALGHAGKVIGQFTCPASGQVEHHHYTDPKTNQGSATLKEGIVYEVSVSEDGRILIYQEIEKIGTRITVPGGMGGGGQTIIPYNNLNQNNISNHSNQNIFTMNNSNSSFQQSVSALALGDQSQWSQSASQTWNVANMNLSNFNDFTNFNTSNYNQAFNDYTGFFAQSFGDTFGDANSYYDPTTYDDPTMMVNPQDDYNWGTDNNNNDDDNYDTD